MSAWFAEHNVEVEDVERVVLSARGFEEVLLRVDGDGGRVEVPFALVADHPAGERIEELRLYWSTEPLTGRHSGRPPLLQPDPDLHPADVVGEYQRALAAGDLEAVLATFEPDAYARAPTGAAFHGTDGLRAFFGRLFSNGGGIPLEHCAVVDDGRACALEFNVVRWGRTELPPQPGVAVYVRGSSGKLAAARIYDDADPPLRLGQEPLAAVDVVGRAGQRRVDHEVHRERGDVLRPDDAPDRDRRGDLVAARLRAPHRGATPTGACRRSRRR